MPQTDTTELNCLPGEIYADIVSREIYVCGPDEVWEQLAVEQSGIGVNRVNQDLLVGAGIVLFGMLLGYLVGLLMQSFQERKHRKALERFVSEVLLDEPEVNEEKSED